MASTYTTNLGIEKIGTGEQSGTWGDTTNTNFDILDEAINGIISVTLSSAGSSGSPTALPITDGSSSNGRNKFIEFVDGGDLGGTAYVQLTPNDAEKIVHIRNSLSSSRSVIVFQGTYNASNDFEIVNGADVLLKFNGGGSGATVTDVNVDLTVTGATIATADINGGAIDGTVIGGASAAAITATTITGTTITASTAVVPDASDGATLGSTSLEWSDLYLADGAVVFFGDDQDITLTHVADTGLTLKHANTGDDKFPTFLLATGDTDIAADDKLGVINFQAPDEGAGTDAILVAAGIEAVSEGDFSASSNATSLVFKTGASEAAAEKMRINSAGNVGVGATNPQKALHVIGGVLAASSDGSTSGITIDSTATSGYASTITHSDTGIEFDTGSTLRDFTFDVSGSELMRIDTSSGNVGIGTTSPDSNLHIAGSAAANLRLERNDTTISTGNGIGNIHFEHQESGSEGICATLSVKAGDNSGSGEFTFLTGLAGTTSEKMRIDKDGNVGIGTSSPGGILHLKSDDNGMIFQSSSSSNSRAQIFFQNTGGTTTGKIAVDPDGGNANVMAFSTGSSERMRIDSSGNVGIGATSLSNKLTVNGNQVMLASGELKFADAGNSLVSVIKNGGSGGTSQMQFLVGSTPAEAMRLSSDGRLGIGDTSPDAGLTVHDNAGAVIATSAIARQTYTSVGNLQVSTSGSGGILIHSGSSNSGFLTFGDGAVAGRIEYSHSTNDMTFMTGANTRMTLDDSGNLLVGTTTLGGDGISILPRYSGSSTTSQIRFNRAATSTEGTALLFMDNSVIKGSIKYTNSATSFNTSSDQRLKENIVDAPAGNIDDIRVRSFDWKVDGSHQKYGVVAQELVNAAPEAVTVEDDEEKTMQVDHSKLVPMMIKEIQDLKAEVAALKGA